MKIKLDIYNKQTKQISHESFDENEILTALGAYLVSTGRIKMDESVEIVIDEAIVR